LQVGGGEILAMNLAAGLDRLGHRVVVFNQRAELHDAALVERLLPSSVRVLSMADRPRLSYWAYKLNALGQRLGLHYPFYERAQQAYFRTCLKRYQIDVVNSHATYSDRLCAPELRDMGIPFIITEHGEYTIFLLEGRQDLGPILNEASAIVTVSDYCQHQLRSAFIKLPVMRTIYNGVVTNTSYLKANTRKTLGIGEGDFIFGMAARGVELKGWEQAIEALKQVQDLWPTQKVHFVLVGGGPYMDVLQKKYSDVVGLHFTGRVSNPDFYMVGFDVGLLPSYFPSEALPLSIIEYMTYGLPTIATHLGGIPELLIQARGRTGQLIAINEQTGKPDVAQLRNAMLLYLSNTNLYTNHANNAAEAGKEYTMEKCAKQYEQVYYDASR
jgi:glycosyltransferase involved in cell wall biosynthesis